MTRASLIDALGAPSQVHLLDIELGAALLGGKRPGDTFDGERIRETANLIKRVCTKQKLATGYAVTSVRDMNISVRCGFSNSDDRDLIAALAGAADAPAAQWASRRYLLLDPPAESALNDAGIPRDNKGAGRRAREKQRSKEEGESLRWNVRGDPS